MLVRLKVESGVQSAILVHDCRVHDEVRYSAQPSLGVLVSKVNGRRSPALGRRERPALQKRKERELTIYPWLEMCGIESAEVRGTLEYVGEEVPRQSLVL
jgi:hypothetical protein